MEIIEFLNWLFKQFFGEPEKPVQHGPGRGPRAPKRGPYNYGDGRPKTLEQILEEVRLEAARKRGEVQAPEEEPPPVATRQLRSSLDEAAPDEGVPRVSAPDASEGQVAGRLAPAAIEEQVPIAGSSEASAETAQRLAAVKSRHIHALDEVQAITPAAAVPAAGAETATGLARRPTVSPAAAIAHALRSAPPGKRVALTQQAQVLHVILGLPRSKNPLRGFRVPDR